jgi:hypothetical protein
MDKATCELLEADDEPSDVHGSPRREGSDFVLARTGQREIVEKEGDAKGGEEDVPIEGRPVTQGPDDEPFDPYPSAAMRGMATEHEDVGELENADRQHPREVRSPREKRA